MQTEVQTPQRSHSSGSTTIRRGANRSKGAMSPPYGQAYVQYPLDPKNQTAPAVQIRKNGTAIQKLGKVDQNSEVLNSYETPGQGSTGPAAGNQANRWCMNCESGVHPHRWTAGQRNIRKPKKKGTKPSDFDRKGFGLIPRRSSHLLQASWRRRTWHPQPQNQRPRSAVDSSINAKRTKPGLTTPSRTKAMDSLGSMGEIVVFVHSQWAMCRKISP